jgi:hypothetical protein
MFLGPGSLNSKKPASAFENKKGAFVLRGALTIKKLVSSLCIVVWFMFLYALCRLLICDVRGLSLLPCTDRKLMKRKNVCLETWTYKLPLVADGEAIGGLPVRGHWTVPRGWVLTFW